MTTSEYTMVFHEDMLDMAKLCQAALAQVSADHAGQTAHCASHRQGAFESLAERIAIAAAHSARIMLTRRR